MRGTAEAVEDSQPRMRFVGPGRKFLLGKVNVVHPGCLLFDPRLDLLFVVGNRRRRFPDAARSNTVTPRYITDPRIMEICL